MPERSAQLRDLDAAADEQGIVECCFRDARASSERTADLQRLALALDGKRFRIRVAHLIRRPRYGVRVAENAVPRMLHEARCEVHAVAHDRVLLPARTTDRTAVHASSGNAYGAALTNIGKRLVHCHGGLRSACRIVLVSEGRQTESGNEGNALVVYRELVDGPFPGNVERFLKPAESLLSLVQRRLVVDVGKVHEKDRESPQLSEKVCLASADAARDRCRQVPPQGILQCGRQIFRRMRAPRLGALDLMNPARRPFSQLRVRVRIGHDLGPRPCAQAGEHFGRNQHVPGISQVTDAANLVERPSGNREFPATKLATDMDH